MSGLQWKDRAVWLWNSYDSHCCCASSTEAIALLRFKNELVFSGLQGNYVHQVLPVERLESGQFASVFQLHIRTNHFLCESYWLRRCKISSLFWIRKPTCWRSCSRLIHRCQGRRILGSYLFGLFISLPSSLMLVNMEILTSWELLHKDTRNFSYDKHL